MDFFSSQIIAILAAILFPVFARAREKARQSSCLSNIKQIGTAQMMYIQDYDEMIVPYQTGDWSTGRWEWWQIIQPYLKNEQILICPSQKIRDGWVGGKMSYGINRHAGGFRAISEIHKPAETLAFADVRRNDDESQAFSTFYWPGSGWGDSFGSYGCLSNRHNEGLNVAFYDGHAKWFKREAVWNSDMYDF